MNRSGPRSWLERLTPTDAAFEHNVRTQMRSPESLSFGAADKISPKSGGKNVRSELPRPTADRVSKDSAARLSNDPAVRAFQERLQREMLRANRTRIPLSIVLFRLQGTKESGPIKRLYEIVAENRRETDVPVQCATDLVAILLLDTGSDGAAAFASKIQGLIGQFAVSTTTQTHPGPIFDSLASGRFFAAELPATTGEGTPTPRPKRSLGALAAARNRWLGVFGVALD